MSTRSTIYYHKADATAPHIHIFTDVALEDGDDPIRMEIQTEYALIDVPLPKDLCERFGL
jgi:hypothetical protein